MKRTLLILTVIILCFFGCSTTGMDKICGFGCYYILDDPYLECLVSVDLQKDRKYISRGTANNAYRFWMLSMTASLFLGPYVALQIYDATGGPDTSKVDWTGLWWLFGGLLIGTPAVMMPFYGLETLYLEMNTIPHSSLSLIDCTTRVKLVSLEF